VADLIMSSLLKCVRDYLAHRRALGFTLRVEHRLLPKLARFHHRMAPGQPLRTDVILKWAVQPNTGSRNYYVKRLAMARSFARYCAALEPRTQVPDYRLLGRGYQKSTPHIYSASEIRLLLQRARLLSKRRFPHRPITFETLLGLIACTGLRLNEALRLRCEDFDFNAGTFRVPRSKFSPERVLPLHPSTLRAMRRYLRARTAAQIFGDHFFFNRFGDQLCETSVHCTFREIAATITSRGALPRPRIHDLRHTFATRHIARWSRQAAPVAHHLLLLSRYLGHQNFTDTWWYVSADPATLRDAAARFHRFQREDS
jgi:integrase